MKAIIITGLVLLASSALAQEQPKFVPYTINKDDHIKIMSYLLDQPAKMAIPLINILNTLQQNAVKEKEEKK